MLLSGAPQGEARQECQPENRFMETSTEINVNKKIFNRVSLLLPHAPVYSAHLIISKSPTVMKTIPCLYVSCQNIIMTSGIWFSLHLEKKMKVSTLQGHFTNSSGYQCVYIRFSTQHFGAHSKIVFGFFEAPQWHLCLWTVFLADSGKLTLPPMVLLCDWSIKDLKGPFLVPVNWTQKSWLGTYLFSVCCRTRCNPWYYASHLV